MLDDNPALDPEYVAGLKSFYAPGSLFYRRFVLGIRLGSRVCACDVVGGAGFGPTRKTCMQL
jgi:hypothetical protein